MLPPAQSGLRSEMVASDESSRQYTIPRDQAGCSPDTEVWARRAVSFPATACMPQFSVVKGKVCINTSCTMVWCVSKMRQNRLIRNRRKRYRVSNLQYVFPFNLRLLRMHRYAFQACDFLNCLTQQVCSQSAVHKY